MSTIANKIGSMTKDETEKLIDDATQAALNAGCLAIQNAIGQTDGGVAGVVFSDDEFEQLLKTKFRAYLETERWMSASA